MDTKEAFDILAKIRDCCGKADVNDAFWENCESLKIVGNIHDNPELMEEPV